nr:MAG TPA: hypothetical protein [Caudoviricetes sp.]DAT07040.1 MAG TPA: hypothetical protein [Caudoviricetes sp.]
METYISTYLKNEKTTIIWCYQLATSILKVIN